MSAPRQTTPPFLAQLDRRRSIESAARVHPSLWTICFGVLLAAACAASTDTPVSPEPVVPVEVITPSVRCATNLGTFGGMQWQARTATLGGPGPNAWNACQAWLDTDGMHLRLDRVNNVWTSAEVFTTVAVGYGRLEFEVATPLHALDPNVVFGFFTYPTAGLDGMHEIDIEFGRFGVTSPSASNLNYVVYPATTGLNKGQCSTLWNATQTRSTHRFFWSPGAVEFQSYAETGLTSASVPTRAWRYAPSSSNAVSSGTWPLHLNLWLYGGNAPRDGQPVEIVISRISYSPISAATPRPSVVCP